MTARNKSNKIKIRRIYDAPVAVVWNAWTDPKQVAQWWGPRGFSLTTHSKDLRVGGTWNYTMHGPDGVDYPNKTLYLEVEKYSKLVYDHGANDKQAPLFQVTVLFSELNGKTKMDLSMSLPSPEAADQTRNHIKEAGGNSTWDRLAEYLEKESSGKEIFTISRSFDVALESMFELWTNPEYFSKWLPPTGCEMEFIKHDIKSDGKIFYVMTGYPEIKIYGKIEYLKIEKPNLLVYTQQFCDQNENISRHPFAPLWPESMLTTVELTEDGSDQTRIKVTWEPYGNFTNAELEVFINSKAGMTQGWTGSFDKLDAYLLR